jgi:hypothetical protein
VNILPALQSKPSIISLSYTSKDLIPPGDSTHPFSPMSLKLAYSSDGKTWTILLTSVVDPTNKTVAAIHKLGGYYMIVYQPYQQVVPTQIPSVQGVTTDATESITPTTTPEPTQEVLPIIQPSISPILSSASRFCVFNWCW